MDIAIVAFDNMAALDAIGPFEVLAHLPDATVTWVGMEVGVKRTEEGKGGVGINADAAIEELPHPDVIVVPGGHGEQALRNDKRFISWLQAAHETSTWTTSVCTGALLLAKIGLLNGRRATTHWAGLDLLASLDSTIQVQRDARVVSDGIVTSAGVSAGIDMAFSVVERLCGRAVADETAHYIEYVPHRATTAGLS